MKHAQQFRPIVLVHIEHEADIMNRANSALITTKNDKVQQSFVKKFVRSGLFDVCECLHGARGRSLCATARRDLYFDYGGFRFCVAESVPEVSSS